MIINVYIEYQRKKEIAFSSTAIRRQFRQFIWNIEKNEVIAFG